MNASNVNDSDDDNPYRSGDFDEKPRRRKNEVDFEVDEPKKSGWGCVIWTLIILGCTCAVCCCGVGLTVYSLTPKILDKPADIIAVKDQLIEAEIPAGLEPKFGGSWNMMFMGRVTGVAYADEKDKKFLAIMKITVNKPEMKPALEKFKEAILKSNSSGNEEDQATVIKTETKTLEMKSGKQVEFVFKEMENNKDKKKFYTVAGSLSSADSETTIFYVVPEENWDEEKTIEFLKTFKLKE